MKRIKKIFKYILIFVLSILVIANLAILFTGRLYIYKGLSATYFRGHARPTIYDLDVFENRTIKKGNGQAWQVHSSIDQFAFSRPQREYIEDLNPASFLVAWGDTIIYEQYWDKHEVSTIGNSFSMSKSVVSLLIGCAIKDGLINNIDEPVENYLDEFKGDKSGITIRHLLTMSSGLSWSENYWHPFCDVAELYYDTDARDLVLNRRTVENKPGEIFDYKSGDTQTLMYILEVATNKHISDYASEKIWQKIGAESDAQWSLVDQQDSEEKASCCIYATTRDFAKLGKLVNQNGSWNGEQLIDETYFNAFKSLAPLKKTSGKDNQLYGMQYWIYTGLPYEVTYFRGMAGQYIISIPEYDLVIVRTGNGTHENWENTAEKQDDAMEGHRVELPAYISTGMAIYAQAKSK